MFDIIPIISHNLTLADVSCLLCTFKAYNQKYKTGIPKSIATQIAQNYDKITKNELNATQCGINRFLQQNSLFCKKLQPHEHTNALIHYAQTDNITMFHHIIIHESEQNSSIRHTILKKFDYSPHKCSLNNMMVAYMGQKKKNKPLTYSDLQSNNLYKLRILILNKKYEYFDFHNNESSVYTKGWLALHYMAKNGKRDLIPLALSQAPNVNVQKNDGLTALHLAAVNDHAEICHDLIHKYGAIIDKQDINHDAPLYWVTCKNTPESFLMAHFLIEAGANINSQNYNKRTPLHNAVTKGYMNIVCLLIQHGAHVNQADQQGNTPLHLAAYCEHFDIAQLLLEHNASIKCKNKNGDTPLRYAIQKNHKKIIKLFFNHMVKNTYRSCFTSQITKK